MERKINQKGLFADRVNAVRFSPDGKTLATGGGELSRSGDIIIFDVRDRQSHADVEGKTHRHGPVPRFLTRWQAPRLRCRRQDRGVTDIVGKQTNLFEGHTHHVMGVAFLSDGRVLATAGAEGTVSTWDMIIGERKKKIEGWTKEVTSLQFIGATNQIVTSALVIIRVRIVTDDGAEVLLDRQPPRLYAGCGQRPQRQRHHRRRRRQPAACVGQRGQGTRGVWGEVVLNLH